MDLHLPADIDITVKSFLSDGRYGNEADVLREALAALKRRDQEIASIQAGIEDMEAGRVIPWDDAKADLSAKHNFRALE